MEFVNEMAAHQSMLKASTAFIQGGTTAMTKTTEPSWSASATTEPTIIPHGVGQVALHVELTVRLIGSFPRFVQRHRRTRRTITLGHVGEFATGDLPVVSLV